MDNLGGNGGIPTGVGESQKAPENIAPMGEIPNFDEFLKNQEIAKPNESEPVIEDTENQAEVSSEMASSSMPVAMPPAADDNTDDDSDEEPETPSMAALKSISIPRNAEELPKEYVTAITKVIEEDKNEPFKLLRDLDKIRWDMLEKAYGRNKGDGLNGSGGDGSNS